MSQRHHTQNQHMMLVTTNTENRVDYFLRPPHAREAVECLYRIQHYNPFFLYAFVVMPDHCHFLLHVPEHGSVSRTMYMYKRAVSFAIGKPEWQGRFHLVIPRSVERTIGYIHSNPVRAGLCKSPQDYAWSSASGRWDVAELPIM